MIEVSELSKRRGQKVAVDALTFQVHPGRVTGFMGANGAGKSTTIRMMLALDTPTSGTALVRGRPYRSLHRPLEIVGSLLDARSFHAGRSARNHLGYLAVSNALPPGRVEAVLELTGLGDVAGARVGTFSLGMRQRLGIAAALLGDPEILVLDEPMNGLDPEGTVWMRRMLRAMAAEGRTVFVASHLMSEMALTADHLIVIGSGRLMADISLEQMIAATVDDKVGSTPNTRHLARVLPLLENAYFNATDIDGPAR